MNLEELEAEAQRDKREEGRGDGGVSVDFISKSPSNHPICIYDRGQARGVGDFLLQLEFRYQWIVSLGPSFGQSR